MTGDIVVLCVTALIIAGLHFFFQERVKKKLAFTANLQGQTEQAESLSFSVSLLADESEDQWQNKLNQAFLMTEKRRAYNNERMQDYQKRLVENAKRIKEGKEPLPLEGHA